MTRAIQPFLATLFLLALPAACSNSPRGSSEGESEGHYPEESPSLSQSNRSSPLRPTGGHSPLGQVAQGKTAVQQSAGNQPKSADISAGVLPPQQGDNLYGVVVWNAANIYEQPDFLSARIGYFRGGSIVILGERVKPSNPKSPKCVTGWYRLVDGKGYICASKGFEVASTPIRPPGLVQPPTVEEAMPYRYVRVMVDFTPLYTRIPTEEEENMVVAWIEEKKKRLAAQKKEQEEGRLRLQSGGTAANETQLAPSAAHREGEAYEVAALRELPLPVPPTGAGEDLQPAKPSEAAGLPEREEAEGNLAGEIEKKGEMEEEKLPFPFLSAVLMKGFYTSVDSEVVERGSKWYKTTRGKFFRFERALPVNPQLAHGYFLPQEQKFPVGLVLRKNIFGRSWNASGKHLVKDKAKVYNKFFGFPIYREVVSDGKIYYQIDPEGRDFILSWSVTVFRKPMKRPAEIPEGSKWIHVDVSDQTLTAYEGDTPVFVTLVSTGNEKKKPEYMTPRGLFYITSKNVTSTMENLALDEDAYSIEDVPWTMYFYKSYALHGAFWHNVFGNQRSHGCINLTPADARWLFHWTDPKLPFGWHGVFTVGRSQGTAVYVTD